MISGLSQQQGGLRLRRRKREEHNGEGAPAEKLPMHLRQLRLSSFWLGLERYCDNRNLAIPQPCRLLFLRTRAHTFATHPQQVSAAKATSASRPNQTACLLLELSLSKGKFIIWLLAVM